jgi:chromosomal replication initiation ATPase DnaA
VTVDKIAWIVGLKLGVMHESPEEWVKKIVGTERIRRIYNARNLVMLLLYVHYGVSHNEIARLIGGRHVSSIGRSVKQARKWADDNHKVWAAIVREVRESIDAEQKHYAKVANLKVGTTE